MTATGGYAPVGVATLGGCIDGASEQSTGERGPRDGPHAEVLEGREHLTLFLAVDEVVVVLHRDERSEIVCDGVVYARRQH